MRSKYLVVLLILLLVGATGSALYFARREVKVVVEGLGPAATGPVAICDLVPEVTANVGDGSAPPPSFAQDICRIAFALDKNDTAACDRVKIQEAEQIGQGACYGLLALKTNDLTLCDRAPREARDNCYRQVGPKLGGLTTCERIARGDQRDNCIMEVVNRGGADASACPKIQNLNSRDNCIHNTAVRLQNRSLCASITTVPVRQDCEKSVTP